MKKVTTTDIAKLAGVSQTTVSLILNDKYSSGISEGTCQKVQKIAKDLGYIIKNKAKPKRGLTHVIGLLVPTLTNPFFTFVASCVEEYCFANGYNVILCNIARQTESESDNLAKLVARNVDGIITTYTPSNPDYLLQIDKSIPVILLGESDTCHNIQTIGINSEKTGQIIASYLYEHGHRKIAMLTAPISRISLARPRRIAGMRNFLKSKDIEATFYVLEDENEYENDSIYEAEMGFTLTKRLLDNYDFTAVVAGDLYVPGIYKTLQNAGRNIPRDVSVVGIDNNFMCKLLTPTLTSVDHHLRDRSKLAVEQLIERIENYKEEIISNYQVEYSPSLVVRQSSGPVKKKSKA